MREAGFVLQEHRRAEGGVFYEGIKQVCLEAGLQRVGIDIERQKEDAPGSGSGIGKIDKLWVQLQIEPWQLLDRIKLDHRSAVDVQHLAVQEIGCSPRKVVSVQIKVGEDRIWLGGQVIGGVGLAEIKEITEVRPR